MNKGLLIIAFLLITTTVFSQDAFKDCAAICLDKVALVKDYSPNGTCEIEQNAKGILTAYTVHLSETAITPKQAINFKIAIEDAVTKTLWLFSEKTFQQIDVEKVLTRCKRGDVIRLITVDNAFALPHNEILVK